MSKRILITGIGGPAGRSAVGYFKELEYYIIGTDIKDVNGKVDKFYIVPPAMDTAFSTALLDIVKKEKPFLLIPTVTEELPIISRLRRTIERYNCAVFISNPTAVDIANNKLETARFFAGQGVPVPITLNENLPKEEIIKKLGFPLLSKPCFGRGGRGVTVYMLPEELYKEMRQGLIFQEFIPGEEFDVNLFIDRKGKTLSCVVLKKTELKDGIVGNALKVERVERADISQLAIHAAKLLDMEGPLDFDIRLKGNGAPVLLEINARVGGNVLYAKEVLNSIIKACKI